MLGEVEEVILPQVQPNRIHSWHLYVIRLRQESLRIDRNRFIELMAERGIGTSVHFIPLHLQPYWRDRYALRADMFPRSQQAFERLVSLPMYSRMTALDVQRVAAVLRDCLAAQ